MRPLRRAFALFVKLALALVILLLVALDVAFIALEMPRGQRLVLDRVNTLLAGQFRGTLHIDSVDDIDFEGVRGAEVSLFDPDGKPIAVMRGVEGNVDLFPLLRSLIDGSSPLRIHLDRPRIRESVVVLQTDARGDLTIATSFEPKNPKRTPSEPGPGIDFSLASLSIAHSWIHGAIDGVPVDADVTDLVASLHYDSEGFGLDELESRLVARALPRGEQARGSLRGMLVAPLQGDFGGFVTFDGAVDQVPALVEARISGDAVTAAVSVPKAEPASLRRFVPELSIQVPGRLRAFADGTTKRLDLTLDAELGRTRARAAGELRLKPRLEATAEVGVKELDLRALDPVLPALSADADATASFSLDSGGRKHGQLRLKTRRLELDGKSFPASVLDARLNDETITGTLNVPAGGPDNQLRFRIDGLFRGVALDGEAEAQLKLEDLRKVAKLPGDLRGRGLAKASFHLDRKKELVNAAFAADLTGVWVADTAVGRARIEGNAIGALRKPRIALRAELFDVKRPEVKLERATIDANGSLDRIRVAITGNEAKGRRVVGRADVDLTKQVARDLTLVVSNGGVELRASAKSLALRDRGIRIEDMKIEGAGDLELSIQTRPGSMTITGKGRDIDLERIARLLRIEKHVNRGRGTFDVDLRIAGSQISGRANVRVQEAMVDGIGPFDATLDAVSEGGKLDGTLAADLTPVGDLRLRAVQLQLGERGPTLDGLKRGTGRLDLQAKADLGRLPRQLSDLLPFDRTRGQVRLAVDAERLRPREAANLRVYVDTRGLEVLGWSSKAPIEDRKEAIRRKPWRLSGMDMVAELSVLGETGRSRLLARVHDTRGALIDAQAEAGGTVEDALNGGLEERVRTEQFDVRLVVPGRELAHLPAIVRPGTLAGRISLDAQATGTLADPNLALDFRVDRMHSKDPNRRFSMDFRTQARYVARRAEVDVDAANRGKPLMHVHAWADGALPDLLRGKGFVASGQAKLTGMPLALVPILRERQVKGKLFGDVAVTDLGKNATAHAELTTKDLRFGALDVRGAQLKILAENGRLSAAANIDHTGGFARAKLDAGIAWGDRLVFEIDDTRPLEAELLAKDFRAAVLLPFVHETFSDLDGKLDANLRVSSKGGQTQVLGEANLEEGTLQIPAIGQQFREVQAGVRAEPGGILKIENASARALTGKLRAAASARMTGLSLYAADARIRIDHREQIPVTTEGVTLGEAWGDADLSLRTLPEKNTKRVTVKVPRFHLELTEVERSHLQPMDDAEHVRIGVQLEHGKFRRLPLQPLEEAPEGGSRLLLDIDFGDDVWVRQGSTLRVKLQGRLSLDVQEKATASGAIKLSRGVIDVQGKRFEVERGIVSFQDDPANPLVVATARWDSPEGYRVYADYSGRVKNGKLTLRSEPPLSQDEILSLLLFGAPDGSFGSGSGESNQAALAVGVAGGAATKGLNRALGDLTTLDVSTRIDTSYGDPRPEIVVQLTRRLSAELSYAVGEPAPGQSLDRTFLTLDLRLGSRWSLATTFGDRGASMLDLLWRYRY